MTSVSCSKKSKDVFSYSVKNSSVLQSQSAHVLSIDEIDAKDIVTELDRYVVGQHEAKRVIATSLKNRVRRMRVPFPMCSDIIPKNILMIGPTGVGKTEILRRLSALVGFPFLKVEATKYTEVGYMGRDIESIPRDLVERAIEQVRRQHMVHCEGEVEKVIKAKILEILLGSDDVVQKETIDNFSIRYDDGILDDIEIEIEVAEQKNNPHVYDIPGMQVGAFNLADMISQAFPGGGSRTVKKKVKVSQAKELLKVDELERMIDKDAMVREAIHNVENKGIIFIDEIDKIAARGSLKGEVSREGVQRDLLPLIEGTTVNTKYGPIKTDHILFIASGAFHVSKPSDLLPEFQGRFPIRVELQHLDVTSMIRILKDTESSLLKQYCALLETEEVTLKFTHCAINKIAEIAMEVNRGVENIGARRLHTILEKILDDISFDPAPYKNKDFTIDQDYVDQKLEKLMKKFDVVKFIL